MLENLWTFPNIDPVAFAAGPFVVRWYALAYLCGFLLGWRYCLALAGLEKDHRPNKEDVDDFLSWAIGGVILGGRLGYVLFYQFEYYAANPMDILKVWQGGMSFHGGALGVIIALFVFSHLRKFNVLRLADYVCACVPIGLFFGRLANFANGELYGRVTESAWGMEFPNGGPLPRHPSQLYEAALEGAVLFLILLLLVLNPKVRAKPGIVAGAFLAGYGIFRAIIEFFREPDPYLGLIGGVISMGQILSLPMILAGLGVIALAIVKSRKAA